MKRLLLIDLVDFHGTLENGCGETITSVDASTWSADRIRQFWEFVHGAPSGVFPYRKKHVSAFSSEIPLKWRRIMKLWAEGVDFRALLPKCTFYRWQRELLTFGVDLNHVQEVKS